MRVRFITFLCLVLTLLSAVIPGSTLAIADDRDSLFDIRALGILSGVDLTEKDNDNIITRGEFSLIMTNMIGFSPASLPIKANNSFVDISESRYANSINLLCDLGMVNGYGGQSFNPDNGIRLSEALKILVNVLGYNVTMSEYSLEAYRAAAGSIGLIRGINSTSEYVNIEMLATLITNAIDIKMLSNTSFNATGGFEIRKDDTYRNKLMSNDEYIIQKLHGVVTADSGTYLNTKIIDLDRNQLEIEGKIYNFENTAPIDIAGIHIEFYQRLYNDGSQTVFDFRISNRNNITKFRSIDITESSDNRIRLTNKSISFSNDVKYIYNGRLEKGWNAQKIDGLSRASFKAIDNDENGSVDVFYIWEYENRVVERVYAEDYMLYFKDSLGYSQKYISLDPNDEKYFIRIIGLNGEVVAIEDVAADMVASIAVSRDGEAIMVALSDNTIEDVLNEISEDTLKIGDIDYEYEENILPDIKLGETVKFYLNFENVVVYADKGVNENYAYVYGISKGQKLGEEKVKLLIPGPTTTKYAETEDLEGGGASTKTPKLFARNEEIVIYDLASKVSLDGVNHSLEALSQKISNKAVSFTMDSEGRVKAFELLTPYGTGITKYYNANELTFGKTDEKAFGISESITRALCVPTNDASDDDLAIFTELLHDVKYNVVGYEVDETTNIADIIVIEAEMKASNSGIVNSSSTVAIVDRVSTGLLEDEIRIKVSLIHDKEKHEYYVSEFIPNGSSFASLRTGDLIAFSIDGFDYLNGFTLIHSASNYNDDISNEHTENEKFCGIVKDIEYNYVSPVRNRWVNGYSLGFRDSSATVATYEAFVKGNTPVFIIENSGNVRSGSYDDILFGSRVFFSVRNGNVRAVVIDKR